MYSGVVAPSQLLGLLGITHPIIQAGMARQYTSARLVAAVSESGALGILGCLARPADEVLAEIRGIRALTAKPFGVNFVLHRLDVDAFEVALAERVPVFSFFRGDPSVAIARAHRAGALTIHQVTTTEEALQAARAGADVIVAQGTEAGGHGGLLPLSALLPDVIRLIRDRPVIAAGGIVDRQGLAASIALGAAGVLMGTRFLPTAEAPASPNHKRAIVEAGPDSTVASDRFDLLWEGNSQWPGVRVRALNNRLARFVVSGDEARFEASVESLRAAMARAVDGDDPEQELLMAGMGASRITAILPVNDVVQGIVA